MKIKDDRMDPLEKESDLGRRQLIHRCKTEIVTLFSNILFDSEFKDNWIGDMRGQASEEIAAEVFDKCSKQIEALLIKWEGQQTYWQRYPEEVEKLYHPEGTEQ